MAASKAKRKSSSLLDNVKTIVYAGLIAVAIRTFLFEPFNIPSGSMIPTLLVGDYLFVEKYSFGYSQYSMPLASLWPRFPGASGRIFGSLPHRGEVVVFRYPPDPSEDYIKRVIGLPGDHVQITNGQLYINGRLVPRQPAGDATTDEDGIHMVLRRYQEVLPGGVRHDILKATDQGEMNNTGVFVVPPHELFMLGDNRDNSADSRFWGFVPAANLVGRAELIFFSIDARFPWWEFWQWPFEIRWSRIGMVIH
jgi:signal peptidase I